MELSVGKVSRFIEKPGPTSPQRKSDCPRKPTLPLFRSHCKDPQPSYKMSCIEVLLPTPERRIWGKFIT